MVVGPTSVLGVGEMVVGTTSVVGVGESAGGVSSVVETSRARPPTTNKTAAMTATATAGPWRVRRGTGFVALLTVCYLALPTVNEIWGPLLWIVAVLSMTIGNVVAIKQTNVMRLLGYSSIAQAGFMLAPFGGGAGKDPYALALRLSHAGSRSRNQGPDRLERVTHKPSLPPLERLRSNCS